MNGGICLNLGAKHCWFCSCKHYRPFHIIQPRRLRGGTQWGMLIIENAQAAQQRC